MEESLSEFSTASEGCHQHAQDPIKMPSAATFCFFLSLEKRPPFQLLPEKKQHFCRANGTAAAQQDRKSMIWYVWPVMYWIIGLFLANHQCLHLPCKKKRNPYFLDTVGSALMHWQAHYHWSLAAGCSAKVGNYHYEGKRCYLIGWTPADAWSCDPPELIGPSFTLVILVGEKDWKGRHILLAKSNLQQCMNLMIWDLKRRSGRQRDSETRHNLA